MTKVERYQEQYPSADILLARQESFFDDLGRMYETRRYAVDPDTGDVGNYLAGYTWYDAAGNVIKQQAEGQRSFAKTHFDSLGRAVKQFVGYDLSETPGCTIEQFFQQFVQRRGRKLYCGDERGRRHDPGTDRNRVRRRGECDPGHFAATAARCHGDRRTDHDVRLPAAGSRELRGLLVR